MQVDFGGDDDVLFFQEGKAGIIRLNRPRALNALSHKMVNAMSRALYAWETDDTVCCVLVEAEGKAFCAGGDVVSVYHAGKNNCPSDDYMADEYRLNEYISRYTKPYVAFMNGYVMGGGVGISLHGSHRIVTPNTKLAMPEATIGYFADVGSVYYLSRMSDNLGLYCALTSARIGWGDCLQTGLGTHAIHEEDYPTLRQSIIDNGEPRTILEQIAVEVDYETKAEQRAVINQFFSGASLEQIASALAEKANAGNALAVRIYEDFLRRSPTSQKVIFRQFAEYRPLSLKDCLRLDYRLAYHLMRGHDLYEGLRAQLIDKDYKPVWMPATLAEVSSEAVDAIFQPLDKELEL